ncbi:MAG: Rieske 2Fe-2S domain-containing protein [Methylophilaceae bacterium]|nr:Rieske 2Fe-2S domain-containing protein [Methylophilaceae bacterium]
MLESERLICTGRELQECAQGVRFALPELGERITGFVVRYNGKPYAFVNQCAHVPVELDWNQGDFFDLSKSYLVCATHGAHYEPQTGFCVMGPCKGRKLQRIETIERDNRILINLKSLQHDRI